MIKSIFEMSFERKYIIRRMEDMSEDILEYILKYNLLNDNISRNHWLDEIIGKLYDIGRKTIDGKHKLKFKDYYKVLYKMPLEPDDSNYLDDMIEGIAYDYDVDIVYNRKELYNKLKEFYKRLCEMFTERHIFKSDIIKLVKEYFEK